MEGCHSSEWYRAMRTPERCGLDLARGPIEDGTPAADQLTVKLKLVDGAGVTAGLPVPVTAKV